MTALLQAKADVVDHVLGAMECAVEKGCVMTLEEIGMTFLMCVQNDILEEGSCN